MRGRLHRQPVLVVGGGIGGMVTKGYTEKQVRLLAEWYLRVHKSS